MTWDLAVVWLIIPAAVALVVGVAALVGVRYIP